MQEEEKHQFTVEFSAPEAFSITIFEGQMECARCHSHEAFWRYRYYPENKDHKENDDKYYCNKCIGTRLEAAMKSLEEEIIVVKRTKVKR